jgi:L-ascorbate metabolism protein UlaG (beta-lactamase superfamily)
MEITFLGHACFRLRGREASVVVDPFSKSLGLPTQVPSRFSADVLAITHDHPGHNNEAMVGGNPFVVRGPGEYEIKGVGLRGVGAYHDDQHGEKLGRVTMYAIEIDDVVVAHLGDLGHGLSEAEQEQLGSVDILLLPVGGGNCLSATQAAEVVGMLEPKVVIPMHYKLPGLKVDLDEPKHFAAEMGIHSVEFQPKLSVSGKPANEDVKVIFLEARAAQGGVEKDELSPVAVAAPALVAAPAPVEHQLELVAPEPKRPGRAKPVTKKPAPARAAARKAAPKKAASRKVAAKKPAARKVAPRRTVPQRPAARKATARGRRR